MSTDRLRILTVCTGNICRSPLAEQLLHARLDSDRFVVTSAGVGAMVGWPMDEDAAEQSRILGGDPTGFVARQLTRSIVDHSDLILTATRAHRDRVARDYPRAMKRVFTLAEFAALGRTAVDNAARHRASVRLGRESDVVDPYGLPVSVHASSAAQTDEFTREIVRILQS